MEEVRPPRWYGWPLKVAGDKGYSYTHVLAWLQRPVIEQVIPQRSDQIEREGRHRLDRAAYKERARVEQCVGWLKASRRVGTRYDKLASSFLASSTLPSSEDTSAPSPRMIRQGGPSLPKGKFT
jgi:Transposase DDE domain